jgi:hypothetical protein
LLLPQMELLPALELMIQPEPCLKQLLPALLPVVLLEADYRTTRRELVRLLL